MGAVQPGQPRPHPDRAPRPGRRAAADRAGDPAVLPGGGPERPRGGGDAARRGHRRGPRSLGVRADPAGHRPGVVRPGGRVGGQAAPAGGDAPAGPPVLGPPAAGRGGHPVVGPPPRTRPVPPACWRPGPSSGWSTTKSAEPRGARAADRHARLLPRSSTRPVRRGDHGGELGLAHLRRPGRGDAAARCRCATRGAAPRRTSARCSTRVARRPSGSRGADRVRPGGFTRAAAWSAGVGPGA